MHQYLWICTPLYFNQDSLFHFLWPIIPKSYSIFVSINLQNTICSISFPVPVTGRNECFLCSFTNPLGKSRMIRYIIRLSYLSSISDPKSQSGQMSFGNSKLFLFEEKQSVYFTQSSQWDASALTKMFYMEMFILSTPLSIPIRLLLNIFSDKFSK